MAGKAIGEMNVVLSMNTASYSEAIDLAKRKLDQLAGASKQIGHSTVSSVQAASGALRELNGDFTNNIRAVERFITTIPGVGNALKAAFPVVGGLAFGAMIVEMGVKVAEFIKNARLLPDKIRDGFRDLNGASQLANDELRLLNDNLEMQIAKLKGKPENNLALALHESWVEADKLNTALTSSALKVHELLAQNKIGAFSPSNMISSINPGWGQDSTAEVSGTVDYYNKRMREAGFQKNVAVHAGDTSGASKAQQDYETALSDYAKWLDAERTKRTGTVNTYGNSRASYESVYGPQSANLNILEGERTRLYNVGDEAGVQAQHSKDEVALKQQEVEKQRSELAKQAQRAGQEAQRKAQEEQMKTFESGLAQLKMDHQVSTVEEDDYWSKLLAPAQKYPDNLRRVQERLGQVRQAMGREIEEMIKKLDEAQKKHLAQQKQTDGEAIRLSDELDRQARRSADFTSELSAVRTENADALAQMVTAHNVATGAISRHDAAVMDATAHAATYSVQLKKLDEQRDADNNDASLTAEQRYANDRGRDVQRAKIEGERDRTALQDSWKTFQTTGLGGATEALDQFIAATKDSSVQMRSLIESIIGGVNDTILRQITGKGQRGDWTHLGQDVFSNVAGTALKKGEGALLSGLGFGGKADGTSQATALWVRMAGGAGSAVNGIAKTAMSGLGGFLSKLGPVFSNIPFPMFADGVDNFGGGLAIVGERGPELVNLPKGSGVTPNGAAFGGGDVHHHTHNWDLRGAGDPAQVRAVVQQEFQRHGPTLVAASVKATHEYQRRRPSSSR